MLHRPSRRPGTVLPALLLAVSTVAGIAGIAAIAAIAAAAGCRDGERDDPAALARGEELLRGGDFAAAYRQFDRLRRRYPDEPAPYAGLVRAAIGRGRPGDAIPALARRARQGGAGAHVYRDLLGALLERADRRREAEREYREALRRAPGYAPAYLHLSRLLARSARITETLAVAREGVKRCPADAPLRAWYGDALMKRRRYAEAERELRQALALPGAGAYARYTLGLLYLNSGRPAEARRELALATGLAPGAPEGWYQLANACDRLGDGAARDRALRRFASVYRPPAAGQE